MTEGDYDRKQPAVGPERHPKGLEVPALPALLISYCSPSSPNRTTIAAISEPPSVNNMSMWSADISHLSLCVLQG